MKRTITLLSFVAVALVTRSQTVADFESFSLPANSFYKDTNSVDFQTANAIFRYEWTKGSFSYWSGGSAYTNKADSSNGGFTNLYNCIAYKGYNNSNYYVTSKDKAVVVLKAPNNYVDGFYVTNTTYAWKSMKSGDSFAKKFGGSSGNDPDWFKLTVRGYLSGVMKTDSATFYLADYRFSNNSQDYIVKNWQYVNCYNLGAVDSVKFFLSSSDVGSSGMNTPAFFSIDNFITSQGVGINEISQNGSIKTYPNPAGDILNVELSNTSENKLRLLNILGEELNTFETDNSRSFSIDVRSLQAGVYFIENGNSRMKFIKN